MKARRMVGWLILLGAGAYAATKAGPVIEQVSANGMSLFFLVLILLLLLFGIGRVLSS